MRLYETIFILRSDLSDEQAEEVARGILGELARLNLDVLRVDSWGKKRLAYMVKKHKYGYYTLAYFRGEAEQISKLERFYRINEQVIKSIVVRVERERDVLAMIEEHKSRGRPAVSEAQDAATKQGEAGGQAAAQASSVVSVQEEEAAPGDPPEESP
ncbi:MAG: 30S ribosomal protein S6 [Candidatus Tectomicrobia bacterium]|nr:30S ribosomal protein S6 [Candidatus Tectomicrobia bacterium]